MAIQANTLYGHMHYITAVCDVQRVSKGHHHFENIFFHIILTWSQGSKPRAFQLVQRA